MQKVLTQRFKREVVKPFFNNKTSCQFNSSFVNIMKLKFAIFQIYTIEQFFQEVLAPSEACIVNISVLRPVDETLSL